MLTTRAKDVLKMLNDLTGGTERRITYVIGKPLFCLWDDNSVTCDFSPYAAELNGIMEMLTQDGEIMPTANHVFRLTQKGLHYKELQNLTRREKWKERAYGFMSGVAISVLGSLLIKWLS